MDTISRKTNIPKPELQWEEGIHSLEAILDKFPLPRVAECDPDESNIPVEGPNFQLLQPLVLYRERNVKKVPARSLCVDAASKKYIVLGDPLLIPQTYQGWFAVLGRDGSKSPDDKVIPHYKTVSNLATSNTDRFLVGGKRSVFGLRILDRTPEMKHLKFEQVEFRPGVTLKKGKVFIGQSTKKKKHHFGKTETEPEKFLMCKDEQEMEVILPLTQNGTFYTISGTTGKIHRPIMQMDEIVSQKLAPCVVTLLVGKGPTTPALFTGLLGLYEPEEERSILAATIMNFRNIMLELPVESCMKFRVAANDEEVTSHKGYQTSLNMCKERAESYTRNIKVCYDMQKESDSTPEGTPTASKKQKYGSGAGNEEDVYQNLWKTKEGKNRIPSKMISLSQHESSTDGSLRMPPAGFSLRSNRSSVRLSIVNSSVRLRNSDHTIGAGVYIDFPDGESSTDFKDDERLYDNSKDNKNVPKTTPSQSRRESSRGPSSYAGGSITSNTSSVGYESILHGPDDDYSSIPSSYFRKGHNISDFQIRRSHNDSRTSAASLFSKDSRTPKTENTQNPIENTILKEDKERVSPSPAAGVINETAQDDPTSLSYERPVVRQKEGSPVTTGVEDESEATRLESRADIPAPPSDEITHDRADTPPPDYDEIDSDDSWGDDFDDDEPSSKDVYDYENVESLRELMAQLARKRSESHSGSSSEASEKNSQADATSLKDIPAPDA